MTGTPLIYRAFAAEFQAQTGAVFRFVNTIPAVSAGRFKAAAGLAVTFSSTSHVRPEPQPTTLTVRGLARDTIDRIVGGFEIARNLSFTQRQQLRAGRLRIIAGYRDNYALICDHEIIKVRYDRMNDTLTLEAQDGRVPWENSFVVETLPGGADLSLVQDVLQQASNAGLQSDEDFKNALLQKLPEYQAASGNVRGKRETGYVLLGPTKRAARRLNDTLGIRQFRQGGRLVTVSANAATLDRAVVLAPNRGRTSLERMERGFVRVESLMIPQLFAGRQVLLQSNEGLPEEGGVFRVDEAVFAGDYLGDSWGVTCRLRPTALG